ncbi:MAG TPA: AMIN domain-containing protein [Terriglobales bacterium]|nr:AMIN domain-containing protein [Terriglobales bacterium]
MWHFSNSSTSLFLAIAFCVASSFAHADSSVEVPTIRRISILAGSTLELEIAATGPIKPQAQVIQGPDRLILDFPGAVPAKSLHNLDINRGDVKDARVGLFSSNPPVTRVVLDLKSAQPYELFPSGNTVVVKFSSNGTGGPPAKRTMAHPASDADATPETIVSIERSPVASDVREKDFPRQDISSTPARYAEPARVSAPARAAPAQNPRVEVLFENGLLSIRSNKASLSEVLSEIHRRTGAEIAIPPGAESEQVFTSLGPGAPKEVLASLLNGSHFNFIVIGSERDPGGIRRVVLTPKEGGAPEAVVYPCGSTPQPAMAQAAPDPGPPAQAFQTPMPPEQNDPADAQDKQPPPQQ